MELSTTAFADMGVIPAEFAFCAIDPATHVKLSANRNPDFALDGSARRHEVAGAVVPRPGRAVARRRRQPGGSRRAGIAAARRFLPLGADRPAARHAGDRARRVLRRASPRAASPGPHAPRDARQGINDYTGWFAGDKDMAGNYFGYDGPCPPWNDELPHRYVFTLYALDVPRLGVGGRVHRRRRAQGDGRARPRARRPSPVVTRSIRRSDCSRRAVAAPSHASRRARAASSAVASSVQPAGVLRCRRRASTSSCSSSSRRNAWTVTRFARHGGGASSRSIALGRLRAVRRSPR